jgi:DNA-binding transcriptional MerR regulator
MDPDKKISFEELCAEAQVSERTVRYYVHEGLLPPSEGSGRAAGYRRNHLLRLVAIRYLNKVLSRSLAEIKEEFKTISRQQLETYYREAKTYIDPYKREVEEIKPAGSAGSSALEYLKSVRASQSKPAAAKYQAPTWQLVPGDTNPSNQVSAHGENFNQFRDELEVYSPTNLPGESWQHVILAPGVELHFKSLASHDKRFQKITRLLAQAKDIFDT